MSAASPFAASSSKAGTGTIALSILPPAAQILHDLSYQYPLKLIAPTPQKTTADAAGTPHTVHAVFLLTYGGGLVAGDAVDLSVTLAPRTRLLLLTQGSTKIFKSPADGKTALTTQCLRATLAPGAALVSLPDPVQPFAASAFAQRQSFVLRADPAASEKDWHLCVLDWVSSGRPAREPAWSCRSYASRNEVFLDDGTGAAPPRLLLRDAVVLDADRHGASIAEKVDGAGALGSLILAGALFRGLADFFLAEFAALPRLGAKQFDDEPDDSKPTSEEAWRARRLAAERRDGVLWTAARSRGFVVVRFSARDVQGARSWIRDMLAWEGSVGREFGERAALCLR